MKLITVSKRNDGPWCHECPLWDSEWSSCGAVDPHPNGEPRATYDDPGHEEDDNGSPSWCPLKSGDVVIRAGEVVQ